MAAILRRKAAPALAAVLCLAELLLAADFGESVGRIIETYCTACRGEQAAPAGGLRLTPLLMFDSTRDRPALAARAFELVEAQQMPLAGLPAPTPAERRYFVEALDALLPSLRSAARTPASRFCGD